MGDCAALRWRSVRLDREEWVVLCPIAGILRRNGQLIRRNEAELSAEDQTREGAEQERGRDCRRYHHDQVWYRDKQEPVDPSRKLDEMRARKDVEIGIRDARCTLSR